jgi:threonine/homoserine/homoserine lactone efflux protein
MGTLLLEGQYHNRESPSDGRPPSRTIPALFFLAFSPQLVEVSRGSVGAQVFGRGLVFVGLGVAAAAGSAHRASRSPGAFAAPSRGHRPLSGAGGRRAVVALRRGRTMGVR